MFGVIYLLIGLILTMVYLFSMGEEKVRAITVLVLLFLWPIFVYCVVKDRLDKKEGQKTK